MQEKTTVARTALKNGAIFGVIGLVFAAILYVFELMFIPMLPYVAFIILGVGINLSLKEFKEDNEGFLSYGEAMSIGTLMSAVSGIIIAIFVVFYVQFIDASFNEKALAQYEEAWRKQGLDDGQIERSADITKFILSPGIVFFLKIAEQIIVGCIVSLILGALYRKNKPVFE